jgi:hypothetical protein
MAHMNRCELKSTTEPQVIKSFQIGNETAHLLSNGRLFIPLLSTSSSLFGRVIWLKKAPSGKPIQDQVYEGQVNQKFEPDGPGVLKTANGTLFEGIWVLGALQSQSPPEPPRATMRTGLVDRNLLNVYKMRLPEEIYQGTIRFPNGDLYEGEIVADKPHGRGTCMYANKDRYEGQWSAGKRAGEGTQTYQNGDVYKGKWKNDLREGCGTMDYFNAGSYGGNWLRDKKHGKGARCYKQMDRIIGVYDGDWFEDNRHGRGELILVSKHKYIGDWDQDYIQGQGQWEYPDGALYRGDFVKGQRQGLGTHWYIPGHRYVGQWLNDQRYGRGTMYYANGTIRDGEWKDTLFRGKLIRKKENT